MDAPVVVVGTGPSGAMAAHVLTERGVPAVVLESGTRFPGGRLVKAFGRTVWRQHARKSATPQFTPTGDPSTTWFADYAPGGLSNHWTGAVPRYAPEDFREGAKLGAAYAWPITYEDVSPFYRWSEQTLVISGTTTNHPAVPAGSIAHSSRLSRDWQQLAERAGTHAGSIMPVPLAAGSPWGVFARSTPFNSYASLLEPAAKRAPCSVRLGAHVTRLNWDPGQARVSSVDYIDRSTRQEGRIEASAVILAAGAVNSARILLSSTSNAFPTGLGNSSGLVGAYLHDHPVHMFSLNLGRSLTRLGHIAYLTRLPYDDAEPLSAAQCTMGGRMSHRDRVLAALPLKTSELGVIVFGTMQPLLCNRVSLSPHLRDDFDVPVPDIRIHFASRDTRTAYDAESRLVGLFDELGLHPRVRWRLPQISPGAAVHFAGTARMHASPEFGVVDGLSRLHECPNVIVGDASVFTTCVEKNPTLTAMALAARAADALSGRLRSGHAY